MPIPVTLPAPLSQRIAEADGPLFGIWVATASATMAEIAGASGFEVVIIDGEHTPVHLETTVELLRALAAYPLAIPLVRVPSLDRVFLKQVLEIGAQNILIPMIDTVEQAKEAVAAVRYPPRGVRGVGSYLGRSSRWAAVPDYLDGADDTISLYTQVESQEAIENLPEILAVDGIDGIFIGPADLSASMGLLGQELHPDVIAAVKKCIDMAKAAGKQVGLNAFDIDQAHDYARYGADFVMATADTALVINGAAWMQKTLRAE